MIFVKDLRRMATFYGDVLGLKPIDETRTDTYLEFDAGGSRFALHTIPAGLASERETSSPAQPREGNPIRLDFVVPDVERERVRLAALGITLLLRPWGACDAVDPEGNVIGLRAPVQAN